jgi:hypothetical protein
LEKIGAKVFDEYSNIITDIIKGHQGIYALYRKDRLYYVGLASNLKSRIKAHQEDKHRGKWTHFSLYIIRKQDHIRELESLILRTAYPKGNSIKGKLNHSRDLRPCLKEKLREEWEKRFGEIIGGKRTTKPMISKRKNRSKSRAERPLKNVFKGGKTIYANYKGKEYKGWVNRIGKIKYANKYYESPSIAGLAVTGRKALNGWKFWKYRTDDGKLVYLDEARK